MPTRGRRLADEAFSLWLEARAETLQLYLVVATESDDAARGLLVTATRRVRLTFVGLASESRHEVAFHEIVLEHLSRDARARYTALLVHCEAPTAFQVLPAAACPACAGRGPDVADGHARELEAELARRRARLDRPVLLADLASALRLGPA